MSYPKILSMSVDDSLGGDLVIVNFETDDGWSWWTEVVAGFETTAECVARYKALGYVDGGCEPNPEGEV